jgi:ribosome-associated protein
MSEPAGDALGASATDALVVSATLVIPRVELQFRATRAGGPGGQHVNTSSTRVELLWNVTRSTAIDDTQRATILDKLAGRLDAEGTVRVVSSESRSQRQNRQRAEDRLAELLRTALRPRKTRRPTKRPRRANEARLADKKRRSERKRDRRDEP